MVWHLYVLRCRDGTLYAGITTDVERRLAEHETGRGSRYVRGRAPLTLLRSWDYEDGTEARRAEARFKRLARKAKLAALGRDVRP